jgi:kynurenine formamidase
VAFKLPSRIVDISMPIDDAVITDPTYMRPEFKRLSHADTISRWQAIYPGLEAKDLPGGLASAYEYITLTTHNGTHVDAPFHYHPVDKHGNPMPTIDQMPLDWYMRPAVKLDFRRFEDGYVVRAQDVEDELKRVGHELQPLDIVLVNTRAGGCYGQPDFNNKGCGMGREATLYLTSRGVRVTGTDAWGWDAPFALTAQHWKKNRDPSVIWEGHYAGIETPYSHMEKMQNLEQLPANGFAVACFPVKIRGGTAGWTRAVALFE